MTHRRRLRSDPHPHLHHKAGWGSATGARRRAPRYEPYLAVPLIAPAGHTAGVVLWHMDPAGHVRLLDYADAFVFATRLGMPSNLKGLAFADRVPFTTHPMVLVLEPNNARHQRVRLGMDDLDDAIGAARDSGGALRLDLKLSVSAGLSHIDTTHVFAYGTHHPVAWQWRVTPAGTAYEHSQLSSVIVTPAELHRLFGPPPNIERGLQRHGGPHGS